MQTILRIFLDLGVDQTEEQILLLPEITKNKEKLYKTEEHMIL